MTKPTILIGVGGIGMEILEIFLKLAKRMNISPESLSLHYIDTNRDDINRFESIIKYEYNKHFKKRYGIDIDYSSYLCPSIPDVSAFSEQLKEEIQEFEYFWTGTARSIAIDQASANRSNGVLLFLKHLQEQDPDIVSQVIERVKKFRIPNIFMVGSLFGGTGSGIILPLAALIKIKKEEMGDPNLGMHLFGIFPLFEACSKGAREFTGDQRILEAKARNYGTLREINFWQTYPRIEGFKIPDPKDGRMKELTDRIFEKIFIVSDKTPHGKTISNEDYKPYLYSIAYFIINLIRSNDLYTKVVNEQDATYYYYGSLGFFEFFPPKKSIISYYSVQLLDKILRRGSLYEQKQEVEEAIKLLSKTFFEGYDKLKEAFRNIDFINGIPNLKDIRVSTINSSYLSPILTELESTDDAQAFKNKLINLVDNFPTVDPLQATSDLNNYIKRRVREEKINKLIDKGFFYIKEFYNSIIAKIDTLIGNDKEKGIIETRKRKLKDELETQKKTWNGEFEKKSKIKRSERRKYVDTLNNKIKVNWEEIKKLETIENILFYLKDALKEEIGLPLEKVESLLSPIELNCFENLAKDEVLEVPDELSTAQNVVKFFNNRVEVERYIDKKHKDFLRNNYEDNEDTLLIEIVEKVLEPSLQEALKELSSGNINQTLDNIILKISNFLLEKGFLENYEEEMQDKHKDKIDKLTQNFDKCLLPVNPERSPDGVFFGIDEEDIYTFGKAIFSSHIQLSDARRKLLYDYRRSLEDPRISQRKIFFINQDWVDETLPYFDECGPDKTYVSDYLYLAYHSETFQDKSNEVFKLEEGKYIFVLKGDHIEFGEKIIDIITYLKEEQTDRANQILKEIRNKINKTWKNLTQEERKKALEETRDYLKNIPSKTEQLKYRIRRFEYRLQRNWHIRDKIL